MVSNKQMREDDVEGIEIDLRRKEEKQLFQSSETQQELCLMF